MRMDRQTNVTKLIVPFRNSAIAPKTKHRTTPARNRNTVGTSKTTNYNPHSDWTIEKPLAKPEAQCALISKLAAGVTKG